jgi:hypothetical protein
MEADLLGGENQPALTNEYKIIFLTVPGLDGSKVTQSVVTQLVTQVNGSIAMRNKTPSGRHLMTRPHLRVLP